MKRPWILTPKGQRFSLHIANVLSLALFIGYALQFQFVEQPRTQVPQLQTNNVTYCEISECEKVFGIELENGDASLAKLKQTAIGVELKLEFTNSARWEGRRELWLKMQTQDGSFVEAASTWIELGLKQKPVAIFVITGTVEEISQNKLLLGY